MEDLNNVIVTADINDFKCHKFFYAIKTFIENKQNHTQKMSLSVKCTQTGLYGFVRDIDIIQKIIKTHNGYVFKFKDVVLINQ